jgi:pantoate--beta-alanine ligase
MQVLDTIAALRRWRAAVPLPIGFVPTMGYLHEGHLSLMRRAQAENATVAVSIFVNPTQFGPHDDFQRYPRDPDRDYALLTGIGIGTVFTPGVEEMYPPGGSTIVDVEGLSTILEGASRPGHFRGVATVVSKLLHIIEPQRAYFGEKDYQQLQVIQQMVRDLRMAVEVIGCPTIREPGGLAMSSRNIYLSPTERQAATTLPQALFQADDMAKSGVQEAAKLASVIHELLAREPLIRVDYVAIVHPWSLQPLTTIGVDGAVVCLAVRIGRTRLIDNVRLSPMH